MILHVISFKTCFVEISFRTYLDVNHLITRLGFASCLSCLWELVLVGLPIHLRPKFHLNTSRHFMSCHVRVTSLRVNLSLDNLVLFVIKKSLKKFCFLTFSQILSENLAQCKPLNEITDNIIIRLMLLLYLCPKRITLSGFHCTENYTTMTSILKKIVNKKSVNLTHFLYSATFSFLY